MNQQVLQALRSSELTAAQVHEMNFFKTVSPEKVFVVDVKGDRVVYGWAFQGKGEAGEHVLRVYGIGSDECNLRFSHAVSSDSDWQQAKDKIRECYHEYFGWTKEELLDHIKDLRKAFIQRFTSRLKPLGFRKTSNHWKKNIHDQFVFEINAQKSGYSDQYYVNLSIEPSQNNGQYRVCFHTRAQIGEDYLCDWQLTSGEIIDRALDEMVSEMVRPVLEMDCAELGRQDFIQKNCHCNRKLCAECWVEKNYWEHCGIPEP